MDTFPVDWGRTHFLINVRFLSSWDGECAIRAGSFDSLWRLANGLHAPTAAHIWKVHLLVLSILLAGILNCFSICEWAFLNCFSICEWASNLALWETWEFLLDVRQHHFLIYLRSHLLILSILSVSHQVELHLARVLHQFLGFFNVLIVFWPWLSLPFLSWSLEAQPHPRGVLLAKRVIAVIEGDGDYRDVLIVFRTPGGSAETISFWLFSFHWLLRYLSLEFLVDINFEFLVLLCFLRLSQYLWVIDGGS